MQPHARYLLVCRFNSVYQDHLKTMKSNHPILWWLTADTVTVTFYRDLMTSPYQGYDIVENDSVTTHQDSITVAVLAPNQYLIVQRQWSGLYREELVVPAWDYIASITVGDTALDRAQWTTESLWHVRTNGGRFVKDESRHYDLWLRDQ